MNKILWTPDSVSLKESKIALFMSYINQAYSTSIKDYPALHEWSINNIDIFWKSVSDFFKIQYSSKAKKIIDSNDGMFNTKWFVGAKLNYAENIFHSKDMQSDAIEFFNELGDQRSITYQELYRNVSTLVSLFKNLNVIKGDRVAAMMPNLPETVISSLASSSIGAIWSSCSPDFGTQAVFDRFNQINPKILIISDGYTFKGKRYDCKVTIDYLLSNLQSLEHIIIFNYINADKINHKKCTYWNDIDFTSPHENIEFTQLAFEDPLYIMFSSGTTGKPKSIVHSVGGTLIQHIKELGLHTNLAKTEKILYYTTCGWMMWNWLLSGLYFGATIVLYEGSPFYPDKYKLLEIVDQNDINIFGTSARYISYLQGEKTNPKEKYGFKKMRLMLSTGSTLTDENFDYIYSNIKTDLQVSSISGGTDIISCFALGNPLLKVSRGELQCIGLGMDVVSYNQKGESVQNEKGELICKSPFPSMPIYFWNDLNRDKYHKAYFDKYSNVWTHGDFIEIRDSGGVIIYGRSDATLNPGGIRIGTAEIYSSIESIEWIEDSLAVNSLDGNSYILFVKLNDEFLLNESSLNMIKMNIRNNLSPKHIPEKIIQVSDIPYTINGKKVEIAIKNLIEGAPIENLDSLSNPECLKEYSEIINMKV